MEVAGILSVIIRAEKAICAVRLTCRNYISNKEYSRVIGELKSVGSLLEILKEHARYTDPFVETRLTVLKNLCEPQTGLLAMYLIELENLEQKLAPANKSEKEGLIGTRGWPLEKENANRIHDILRRFKTTLELAVTGDVENLLVATQAMSQKLQPSCNLNLDVSLQSTWMGDLFEIHRWLAAPDPSSNHKKALQKRHEDSGSWFIKSKAFTDWKAKPASFLWLSGIPGCGKTILSSVIIEDVIHDCRHNPAMALAFFYFDFADNEKQRHESMIRALILQLSEKCLDPPQALKSLYASCINGERRPTLNEFSSVLEEIVEGFEQIYIILDALDECQEREEVLDEIERIVGWRLAKIHILTTSRKEIDIENSMQSLGLLLGHQHQVSIQGELLNKDIHAYVHDVLQTDSKLGKWPKKVQQHIEQILVQKSDGMFLWVACQLESLRRCTDLIMLRQRLETLPTTLEDTYDNALCNIRDKYYPGVLKIFQWLTFSARPLHFNEVAELNIISKEPSQRFDCEMRIHNLSHFLEIFQGLITTTKTGEAVKITLSHLSVKEYLLSESIRCGPSNAYSIQEKTANALIAEICLAYLLRFDEPDFFSYRSLGESQLARYAAENWVQHAQKAKGVSSRVYSLSVELFLFRKDAFMSWIRLYDPDASSRKPALTRGYKSVYAPLYYASHAGLVELVQLLLHEGIDVNAQGGRYGNALQAASHEGHEKVVQLLLEKGAEINAQGGRYGNALQAASHEGHEKVVQLLLEKGAEINAQGGRYGNALQAASHEGHEKVVQLLLEKGANFSSQSGEPGNAPRATKFADAIEAVVQLQQKHRTEHESDDPDIQMLAASLHPPSVVPKTIPLSSPSTCSTEELYIAKNEFVPIINPDKRLRPMLSSHGFSLPTDRFSDIAFHTDVTSDQDSDENDSLLHTPLSLCRSITPPPPTFMLQSRAIENCGQQIDRYEHLEHDVSTNVPPLTAMYGTDDGRVIKFTPWKMTARPGFIDRIKDVLEKWIRNPVIWWPLQPKRARCPNGYMRISWTCACGAEISVDIPENVAIEYQKRCSPAVSSSSNQPVLPTHNPSTSTSTQAQTAALRLFQPFRRSPRQAVVKVDGSSAAAQESQQPSQYIHWCVDASSYETKLNHIPILTLDDVTFINKLKSSYNACRGFRRWISLTACYGVRFIAFERAHSSRELVACGQEDLPCLETNREYAYSYKDPREQFIKTLEKSLMHSFHNCGGCGAHDIEEIISRIPKKLNGRLEKKYGVLGYGMHALPGWAVWKLMVALVLSQLGPSIFFVRWLYGHPGDLQNAFSLSMYFLALLNILVVIPDIWSFQK